MRSETANNVIAGPPRTGVTALSSSNHHSTDVPEWTPRSYKIHETVAAVQIVLARAVNLRDTRRRA